MKHHVRKHLISGLLLILPLGLTILILRFLFRLTAGLFVPVLTKTFGVLPPFMLAFIAVVLVMMLIYFIGLIGALVIGKRLIALSEKIILGIPLLNQIYVAAKSIVDSFSMSNRASFKSVALVEFPTAGSLAIGFITGTLDDEHGTIYYKVFVPTTPNPTSGFLQILPREKMRQTDMSVEDAIKMVISGGIISPKQVELHTVSKHPGT